MNKYNSGATRYRRECSALLFRGPSCLCLCSKDCPSYTTDHSEKLQTSQAFMSCVARSLLSQESSTVICRIIKLTLGGHPTLLRVRILLTAEFQTGSLHCLVGRKSVSLNLGHSSPPNEGPGLNELRAKVYLTLQCLSLPACRAQPSSKAADGRGVLRWVSNGYPSSKAERPVMSGFSPLGRGARSRGVPPNGCCI